MMDDVGLLDFDRFDELVEIGERDAARVLDEWRASRTVSISGPEGT